MEIIGIAGAVLLTAVLAIVLAPLLKRRGDYLKRHGILGPIKRVATGVVPLQAIPGINELQSVLTLALRHMSIADGGGGTTNPAIASELRAGSKYGRFMWKLGTGLPIAIDITGERPGYARVTIKETLAWWLIPVMIVFAYYGGWIARACVIALLPATFYSSSCLPSFILLSMRETFSAQYPTSSEKPGVHHSEVSGPS